jgi:hypothetical protein
MDKAAACAFLGIKDIGWLEKIIRAGKIKVYKPSYRVLRIHRDDLLNFMEKHASVATPKAKA